MFPFQPTTIEGFQPNQNFNAPQQSQQFGVDMDNDLVSLNLKNY